jgi:hypothetical protein
VIGRLKLPDGAVVETDTIIREAIAVELTASAAARSPRPTSSIPSSRASPTRRRARSSAAPPPDRRREPRPPSLTTWLADLGPAGPQPLDRLTACFLRFVRRHAGALREARSAGLDRSIAGWRSTLADALDGVLRLTVCVAGAPRRPHPARDPVDAAARRPARAARHRRGAGGPGVRRRPRRRDRPPVRRGVPRAAAVAVSPGEPFPIGEPSLRDIFGRHLTTHPDVRDLPIDRTAGWRWRPRPTASSWCSISTAASRCPTPRRRSRCACRWPRRCAS